MTEKSFSLEDLKRQNDSLKEVTKTMKRCGICKHLDCYFANNRYDGLQMKFRCLLNNNSVNRCSTCNKWDFFG